MVKWYVILAIGIIVTLSVVSISHQEKLREVGNSDVHCSRNEPYSMPEEFNRALSLIIQRLSQYSNPSLKQIGTQVKTIRNCLNIQYSTSESEMNNMEGYFIFNKSSSNDNLQIFVSPKYLTKDDLLTALLLQHEITHATFRAYGLDQGTRESCYEDEARALTYQVLLLGAFNQEERDSLTQRTKTSKDVASFFNNLNEPYKSKFSEKSFLQYVKSIPEYQTQCSRYN